MDRLQFQELKQKRRGLEMSREAFERFTKRIVEQQRKNGGNIDETAARKIAAKVAIRHDRKSGK